MIENKQYWIRHNEKQFRLKVRFRKRKSKRRRNEQKIRMQFSDEKNRMKAIRTFQGLLNQFLPRNLLYLLVNEQSLFYIEQLERTKFKKTYIIQIPPKFSIIESPADSMAIIKQICSVFYYQECHTLTLDYNRCNYTDLITQVFLDSVLMDIDKFLTICHRSQYRRYKVIKNDIKMGTIGGENINNDSIQRMMNSVGSPANIINRHIEYENIIPLRLIRFDAINTTEERKKGQKEHDTTCLIDYINNCLGRFGKELNKDAEKNLGYVIGETLINAEQHSSLKYRYVIGYFEEVKEKKSHSGLFNLVIMNFGKTIYEVFKYPDDEEPINTISIGEMEKLSNQFRWKKYFDKDLTEETLWTLYSLQKGVSCIPPSKEKRGNGTINFIESFFKIKGKQGIDNVSHMYILSGNTRIDFDGTYRVQTDKNGKSLGKITFNNSGSFNDRPNSKYVKHVDHYFPGTAIFVKMLIDENDLKNEK